MSGWMGAGKSDLIKDGEDSWRVEEGGGTGDPASHKCAPAGFFGRLRRYAQRADARI